MNPSSPPSPAPLFASFWMGGFEGADHVNGRGVPLDMPASNGHIDRLDEDFAAAAARGIRSVRESIGWRLAEPAPGRFDFTRLHRVASAARRHGVQVLWTFMHYGVPPDIDFLDDRMIDRFARFAEAAANELGGYDDRPVYNLINEIGFLAWAVGETNLIHPYRGDPTDSGGATLVSGYAVKRRLVAAVLAGMAAIRRVDPRARFLHVEPVVHVIAPPDRPELEPIAEQVASYQWQVWDMVAGRADPALGGEPSALDLVGINYYHNGQWEVETEHRLDWHGRDPRRRPLSALLTGVHERYRRPLLITETSHIGVGRAVWFDEVMTETRLVMDRGVPVEGVCLYPLIDRPDWEDPSHWHHSGLWDVDAAPSFARRLCVDYAESLARWQAAWPVS